RDPKTGQLGVAVQSHYFSVGSIVTWAEAGVGAVATQSFVKADYGPDGLDLMRNGKSASEALATLIEADEDRNVRQVAMVDASGDVAAHTGELCVKGAGHIVGDQFSVQANLMLNDTIWPAMDQAFRGTEGDLAERLLAALDAAQAAGGDIRGQQSAALLIVSGEKQEKPYYGRLFDLRVEDHPRPLEELRRLVQLRRAYRLQDEGDEYLTAHEFEKAAGVTEQAFKLAPDIVEFKFWAAVSFLTAGREEEAMSFFRDVFAREPVWAELVPRLVEPGLLPDDPQMLSRILEQNPGK
ncbi:MAG TPA: DUF1028 domain-containing protein, partial [Chloroflexia bacterium]|nr:DUF1028 domain-containing protein [Chloroflexia bacterium]